VLTGEASLMMRAPLGSVVISVGGAVEGALYGCETGPPGSS
jgi:hypothetical protein